MMSRATLRLVLFVSCAHALVHVYELTLPSVEQPIADFYKVDKWVTGWLAATWRIPWGLGALIAGLLVDRVGARRMLTIYLIGCSICCVLIGLGPGLPLLFVLMFLMGTFACIYHPAGLALISHETTAETRPKALGIHGIFGSAGIGLAPFLAAGMLSGPLNWQHYYWGIAALGAVLGAVFLVQSLRHRPERDLRPKAAVSEQDYYDWGSYFTLTALALLQGFVYSGVIAFLPRYLSGWELGGDLTPAVRGSFLGGSVLLVGCFGQFTAGHIARPHLLERQLTFVTLANVPFLVGMAVAQGGGRVSAAIGFAFVHFMHQPIYNSLIAKYTPSRRRSLCYGFSFAVGLGLGGIGAAFTGACSSQAVTYLTLAGVATTASILGAVLWKRNRPA